MKPDEEMIGDAIAKRRGYDSIEDFNRHMDDDGETLYELLLDCQAAMQAAQQGAPTFDGWPENIIAERHEKTTKWVLHYLTDNQAAICKAAMEAAAKDINKF